MSLFYNRYKDFFKYDKDVIIKALMDCCEELIDHTKEASDPDSLAKIRLEYAYESQCDWDLDLDDLGD